MIQKFNQCLSLSINHIFFANWLDITTLYSNQCTENQGHVKYGHLQAESSDRLIMAIFVRKCSFPDLSFLQR